MTTQKKKKSAKQKRVLIGSVVVAVAIVAGSTFAWFSSKDEVTNRLTASADYNVSIVEDFQPPADWLPGQTINKDVAAVNTGNVDAFVRMWLGGALRVLEEDTTEPDATAAIATVLPTTGGTFGAATDPNRTKLGLNYYFKKSDNTITYYKTLSTEKIDNPKDANNKSNVDEVTNIPAMFSEVQSMQAAGILAYAPTGAHYSWTLEQAADLWVMMPSASKAELVTVAAGKKVGTVGTSGVDYEVVNTATDTSGNYYGPIDASTFQPETSGLYLFGRNIGDTADGTVNTYEYSGYYFVKKSETGAPTGLKENTYFALHTADGVNKHSDYVIPTGAVNENTTDFSPTADHKLPVTIVDVDVFTATETIYSQANSNLTWTYSDAASGQPAKFTVDNGKGIVIDIALANIGTDADEWTAIKPAASPIDNRTTFYYNNDLEAGDTTRKLVDNVKLSDDTVLGSYLAFDFDLNVFLDSVQVTLDTEGNESADAVSGGWSTTNVYNETSDGYNHSRVMEASGTTSLTGGEISKMAWS